MDVGDQLQRLVELGIPALAGLSDSELVPLGEDLSGPGLLCIHPALVPASRLAPLLTRAGKPGFVVEDMTDLDEFAPIGSVSVPVAASTCCAGSSAATTTAA